VSKRFWIVLALLAAVFAACLAYGLYAGDAAIVRKNAENFCFS
jgi:hypothetical protein